MKKQKLFSLFILIIAIKTITAQSTSSFPNFIALFPKRELPFVASWDFNNATPFDVPLKKIPTEMYQQYLCNQGIKCKPDYCSSKGFFGFSAFGKFVISDNFYLLLITLDTDAGCDEKWYLISYSSEGKIIDRLLFFGQSYIKRPTKTDQNYSYYLLEGKIMSDSIVLDRKEYNYKNKKVECVLDSNSTFTVSNEGFFVKIVETKK